MTFIMNVIGYPLGWVMWLAYKLVPVYPIALVIFTIIMRGAMLPLSVKQQRNTAHKALLQPEVDEIQKKFSKNPQKAQEEVNKFYEKRGFNPLSGCSSLFLQLPIIYGLIDVVYRPMTHLLRLSSSVITKAQTILEKAGEITVGNRSMDVQLRILGAVKDNRDILVAGIGKDAYDKMASINLNMFGINLGDTPTWAWNLLILIPIFSLLTALLTSYISMKMNDQNMQQGKGCSYAMMFGMPFISAYFSFVVPAGVGLYWIISNVVAGAQSMVLRKIITPEKVAAKLEVDRKKGKKPKKSVLMSKLMAAQQEAVAQQGAYSQSEKDSADKMSEEQKQAARKKDMTDKEKLAEARKKYAEKYGDDTEEK